MVGKTNLAENLYIRDILGQPEAVRSGLEKLDLARLEAVAQKLHKGEYDRVVLTGMGASYYALYPAYLHLLAAGIPAIWLDAAELAHHAPQAIGPKTLLWIVSQSGRSAEVVALLAQAAEKAAAGAQPAGLIAVSNDPDSPLAEAVVWMNRIKAGTGLFCPLHAEPEETPSTRTYLLTLAITQLAAGVLAGPATHGGAGLQQHLDDLEHTVNGIEAYLGGWEMRMGEVGASLVGLDERAPVPPIVLLGRGPSYASALAGALNLQEAAKIPSLGMQAAEFRHGPLEMATAGLSALVFAGESGREQELNRKMWKELRSLGVRARLLAAVNEEGALPMPQWAGIGLPLAEIIPVQLLCVYLDLKSGLVPGTFRNIGKVTVEE